MTKGIKEHEGRYLHIHKKVPIAILAFCVLAYIGVSIFYIADKVITNYGEFWFYPGCILGMTGLGMGYMLYLGWLFDD